MWLGYSLSFWQSVFFCATITSAVAGGISITSAFISAIVGYQISDIVQSDADQRIAEAQAEAAKAHERAATAEQRAAEANLELARMKAPRTLTAGQEERIVTTLRPFAGISFDIGSVWGDVEGAELMMQLAHLLQTAGWSQIDWVGGDGIQKLENKPVMGLVTALNVAVVLHPERASSLNDAATALVASLNAEGIAAKAGKEGTGFNNKNENAVHILIGKKT